MKKIVTAIALTAVSAPAAASPVYLTCSIPREGAADTVMALAVSEDQQIVTYHLNDAELFIRADALFSPSQVRWRNASVRDWTVIYLLDRTTLKIAAVEQLGNKITTQVGTCSLSSAPKRAF